MGGQATGACFEETERLVDEFDCVSIGKDRELRALCDSRSSKAEGQPGERAFERKSSLRRSWLRTATSASGGRSSS